MTATMVVEVPVQVVLVQMTIIIITTTQVVLMIVAVQVVIQVLLHQVGLVVASVVEVVQVAGDKFDLTLPVFKHWGKVFNKYGYELVNESYYSSNYSENCISIVPINEEDVYQYHYPCIVHGCSGKGFGIKFKQWKNLGSKFDCENSVELNKLLKQFINELNTGNKSKKYIQEKQDELNKIAEELNNLYTEWTE